LNPPFNKITHNAVVRFIKKNEILIFFLVYKLYFDGMRLGRRERGIESTSKEIDEAMLTE